MTAQEKSEILFDAMLKVAVTEAFEKEIESLPHDDELNAYTPSSVLDKRIYSLITKSYRRIKAKRFTKSFSKAAACFCILLTITSIVLMSVSATRNAIFNAIIKWHEKYTEIHFGESTQQSGIYRPTYLPEGFSEVSIEPSGNATIIVYRNEAGERLIFTQEKAGNGTNMVDNENTEYYEVQVSGNRAHLFKAKTADDSSILIWEENGIVFELISRIDSDELLRIGESITK